MGREAFTIMPGRAWQTNGAAVGTGSWTPIVAGPINHRATVQLVAHPDNTEIVYVTDDNAKTVAQAFPLSPGAGLRLTLWADDTPTPPTIYAQTAAGIQTINWAEVGYG